MGLRPGHEQRLHRYVALQPWSPGCWQSRTDDCTGLLEWKDKCWKHLKNNNNNNPGQAWVEGGVKKKKGESSEMRRNYEAFKGRRETEIEEKRNCGGFRNQNGEERSA